MTKNRWWLIVAVLSAAALVACGDSTDNDDEDGAGSGGASGGDPDGGAGTASAGTGGTSGQAGTAGTAGTAPVAMPVPCGDIMCNPPPPSPLAGLGAMIPGGGAALPVAMACCIDDATEECGYTAMAGATCEPPATEDERCDSVDTTSFGALGMGFAAFGCCTQDNQCGVDGTTFGRGCVPNEEASSMLMALPLVGPFIANIGLIPEARACDDPGDGGVDESDAGN